MTPAPQLHELMEVSEAARRNIPHTQGVAGLRSLRRLKGRVLPASLSSLGLQCRLACGYIPAACASLVVTWLSPCVSSRCLPSMSGTGRGSCRTSPSGFSAVFPMIALRDAPCSSDHIRVPAVPWLLTADVDVDLAGVLFRLLHWEVKPRPTQPPPALSEGVALSSQRGGMGVS